MGVSRSIRVVLAESRRALRMTQAELGTAVHSSHRSVVRWEGGESMPSVQHLAALATLLRPVSRELATEVAAFAGETLDSLSIEERPSPPRPPPLPVMNFTPVPGPMRPKPEDLVDVVVLAAMLDTGGSAADVRRWLYVAVRRACDVGLTMAEAERALRPAPVAPRSDTDR
jgi:transcriptional regulator with XRE-family HTH domain